MNITIGTPEFLFGSSCILFLNGMNPLGWVFFATGLLGSVARFAVRHAEKLEESKNRLKMEESLSTILTQSNTASAGQYPKLVH